jgi:acetyl-CoA C-acetyltransferase
VPGPRLAALAIDEVVRRAGIEPGRVEAVYAGIGMLGGAALTATRQAVLGSSLDERTPSLGVDRACCSGMTAVGLAWKDVRLGEADLVLAGGFDSLSSTPYLLPRVPSEKVGARTLEDPLTLRSPITDEPIARYTSAEALAHGIDREQQDEWAHGSHQRYFAAEEQGFFAVERFAVNGPSAELAADEAPRRNSSLEALARLAPVYGSATVTAGNAPGLNDGAAFLAIASEAAVARHGLEPLAEILDYVQVADGPTSGSFTPAIGIQKLLDRNVLGIDALDLIEINEAFAATPLVSTLRLAGGDRQLAGAIRSRTNVHGGAVALGHPLGASGARNIMTLAAGLRRRGGGLGAAAICGGFGQGDAALIKVD